MKKEKFSLKNRIKSIGFAINGIKILIVNEHNAWIHLLASFLVIICSLYFSISGVEWMFVLSSIAMVFCAELFNTSIEAIADFISPEKHHQIKKIKDLAAAGVLICAILSVIVASIIFIPKLQQLY